MHFLALLALTGAAIASPDLEERHTTTWNTNSIYSVLATALPGSLISEATDTAKLSSDLAAEFSSATPGWFSSLPADVKSWIIVQGEGGAAAPTGPSSSPSHGTSLKNSSSIASPTLTPSSTGGDSSGVSETTASSSEAASSSSTGGAALPTGMLGGGIAALVGLAGAMVL